MTNIDQCPVNAMEKGLNYHSKAILHLILISMAIQQIRKKKKKDKSRIDSVQEFKYKAH